MSEVRKQVLAACKAARHAGQYVDIDFMLPSVLVHRGEHDEFYYQEAAASELMDYYRPAADQAGVHIKDMLLWAAQGW